MKNAKYIVISNEFPGPLTIRDVGPWNQYLTVTNAVEMVVEDLIRSGQLKPNQRLLYIDSENQMDEILVKDGKFVGFSILY